MILPFNKTKSELRWVGFAGFFICFGSLMLIIVLTSEVQQGIKIQYPLAPKVERSFLLFMFYFSRGIFLMIGLIIVFWAYSGEDIREIEFTEIGGKIVSIDVGDQILKIHLQNNSNSYGINTFKVPDNGLEQIENNLRMGENLFILINKKDDNLVNDPFVQIYGIRTENNVFLSPQDYQRETTSNNRVGCILGFLFIILGFIYLITGNIHRIEIPV